MLIEMLGIVFLTRLAKIMSSHVGPCEHLPVVLNNFPGRL